MPSNSWYVANENRAYPFQKGTVGLPDAGPLTLRNLTPGVIVDAGFVLGPKSNFDAAVHAVFLTAIRREGAWVYFDFATDAPEVFGVLLTFARHVTAGDYTEEFTDTGLVGVSGSSASAAADPCNEPLWSGFLVTGKMAELELLLPGDGVLERGLDGAVLEPALIQNLANSYVNKLALANNDRTRTTAAAGCPDEVFPYPTGLVYIQAHCLVGELYFKPGYNATVRQDNQGNALVLGATVGAGAGEPCAEVALFPSEAPPAGSLLLEGGPTCNEALRSINGIGGRQFNLLAGQGVTITPDPQNHTVKVDVSMAGLVVCFDHLSQRSESC